MTLVDVVRLGCLVAGLLVGYGFGRLLWIRRRVALSFWSVIVALVIVGLATERLFGMIGQGDIWQMALFPLLVGLGTGIAVTPARPPRRAAWWMVWKE